MENNNIGIIKDKEYLKGMINLYILIGYSDDNYFRNNPISDWDTSLVTDMSYLFHEFPKFQDR